MSRLRAGDCGAPRAALGVALGLLALTLPAAAQSGRLPQDELDLQVRSSVVQGSGARAFGMGGAFLARADDATAASWNPAGLSYLRRPEISAVWSRATLDSRVRDTLSHSLIESNVREGQWPDFLSAAFPFEAGSVSGAAQISYQRVVSFTNTRTIERGDRHIEAFTHGGFDVLAFGSGVQLSRALRVGATYNHWFNGYNQILFRRTPRAGNSRQDVSFSLSGSNLHFGLLWSPYSKLNIGASAKTSFTGDVVLRRSRSELGDDPAVIPVTNNFLRDDVRLRLPGAVGIGASWRPLNTLTLSMDYTHSFWSASRIENFFTLAPCRTPSQPALCAPEPGEDLFTRLPYPTLNDDHQRDTEEIRAGVEQVVLFRRVKWPIRVGAFADKQYFNEASGGPPSFTGVTVGTGLILGSVLVDVAYVLEWGRYSLIDTEVDDDNRNSEVSLRSHRLYVSAIYRFGSRR